MVRMPWATYLWPGLPQLWHRGQWSGLLLAVGFAALVNLLLACSFVWVELLSGGQLVLAWLVAGGVWCVSATVSARSGVNRPLEEPPAAATMFRQAIGEYLQENWIEAEQTLGALLSDYPRDVEGRLLLATVLRRSERYAEARQELARVELLQDAAAWKREIADERSWLAAATRPEPAGQAA